MENVDKVEKRNEKLGLILARSNINDFCNIGNHKTNIAFYTTLLAIIKAQRTQ